VVWGPDGPVQAQNRGFCHFFSQSGVPVQDLGGLGPRWACTGPKQGVLAHILYWDTGLTEGWVSREVRFFSQVGVPVQDWGCTRAKPPCTQGV